jgi:Peptidase family M28
MHRLKRALLALLLALLLNSHAPAPAQQTGAATAPAPAAPLPAATLDAAKRITAAQLSEHLHVVASDAMEGRNTPSRGLDEAANYLAAQLKRMGAKPAGDDGSYFQKMTLRRDKIDPARTTFALNDQPLVFGNDFLTGRAAGTAEGQLVYAGHGWVFRSKNIDAYKGLDVRDKIVVVAGTGLPPGVARGEVRGKPGADWEDPDFYARRNGARGLIYVPGTRNLDRWWQIVRSSLERGTLVVEGLSSEGGRPQTLPAVYASQRLLDALLAGERLTPADAISHAQGAAAPAAFALAPEKRVKFSVALASESPSTQNVVAVVEGGDPKLKSEYVALGAHYDHVGNSPLTDCRPVGADSICNGADDDGSGTVAMLAMAEAFLKGPRPRRSILFVWHAGEEHGLWGSDYFTRFPTVPITQIVTQINMDMIGRSRKEGDASPENRLLTGPDEIYVIGSRMMSTELGELSERVNRAYLNLRYDYRYDDPRDPNRFFFRSDHYNYARRGVPIIFFFDGVHEDYHRPTDTPDKIDYQKLEKVTRTIFATAAEIANAPARPRVDKQFPQELADQ